MALIIHHVSFADVGRTVAIVIAVALVVCGVAGFAAARAITRGNQRAGRTDGE